MIEHYKKPAVPISATVTSHFHKLAKQNGIGWSKALRIGISLLLAEKNVAPYDNKLNIVRKIEALGITLDKTVREKELVIAELEGQIKALKQTIGSKDADK